VERRERLKKIPPSVRQVAKILAYFAGVIVLGALLAPLLFWTLPTLQQWALATGLMQWDPRGDQVMVRGPLAFLVTDFQKVFNRAMLVAALLLLWPTVRWLGMSSWRELQLAPDLRWKEHLVRGFFIAALLVGMMGAGYLLADIYRLKSSPPWGVLPKIALSACAVALLEEFLFRGAIMGVFLRAMGKYAALFWTTAIFAILHFLKPDDDVAIEHVTLLSGFALIPHTFHQFAEPMLLLAGFTTIFVLGWVLGYARLRTNALWMSIGLHAGVVFAKMSFSKITKREEMLLPWIGRELQIGLVPVAVLIIAGVLVWWRLDHEELLPEPRSEK
jgi:uncharacterized protein